MTTRSGRVASSPCAASATSSPGNRIDAPALPPHLRGGPGEPGGLRPGGRPRLAPARRRRPERLRLRGGGGARPERATPRRGAADRATGGPPPAPPPSPPPP